MQEGIFTDVLKAFETPKSSAEAAKEIREKHPTFKADVADVSLSRDIRRFRFLDQGITETTWVNGRQKQQLTDKGRELLKTTRK